MTGTENKTSFMSSDAWGSIVQNRLFTSLSSAKLLFYCLHHFVWRKISLQTQNWLHCRIKWSQILLQKWGFSIAEIRLEHFIIFLFPKMIKNVINRCESRTPISLESLKNWKRLTSSEMWAGSDWNWAFYLL